MSHPSPESWFHERATHYVEAQLLFHLNRCGVFAALLGADAPLAAADLAARLGLRADVLATLLDYVAAVDDLLERDDDARFGLTDFGRAVIARYSRPRPDAEKSPKINMFDVRVGAYGPVWAEAGRLLRGEASYGRDLRREGRMAEEGVYTIGAAMAPGLLRALDGRPLDAALEIGVTTGILEILGRQRPSWARFGLDRSERVLEEARARESADPARATAVAPAPTRWLRADLFDVPSWAPSLPAAPSRGVLFSVHFHEFLAAGEARVAAWLDAVSAALPGWILVALEQARLPPEARATTAETLWLYAQSNVLIHHLVVNGRILADPEWRALFTRPRCRVAEVRPLDYLGYHAFVIEFA